MTRRFASWFHPIGLMLLAALSLHAAAETTLAKAADFVADAREAAQKRLPILILFSLPGCPHCEAIRRSHLLALEKEQPARVLARQVDMQSNQELIDFAGRKTTHAAFIRDQQVKFAPVVALVGPDGKRLTEPLVGEMLPDFYGAYLEDAVQAAGQKLRTPANTGQK